MASKRLLHPTHGKTRLKLRDLASVRCETGKIAYPNPESASGAAERQMGLGLVNPGCHIVSYQCTYCWQYHTANKRVIFRTE